MIASSLLAACVRAAAPSAEPELPTAADTAFTLFGASFAPWARRGATEADFKRGARLCLDESADARRSASVDEEAEIAYRTFQECMQSERWTRPAPGAAVRHLRPNETRSGPGGED